MEITLVSKPLLIFRIDIIDHLSLHGGNIQLSRAQNTIIFTWKLIT
jgi:hypothetical protein